MGNLFNKPLGAVSAPFGSCFKCDAWSAVAAGISAASQFATNQINAERAVSDMATYLNLVKKQRDWQKEDQDWSEGMSKRLMDYQNSYNTPQAQMERFKEAGLNPYVLMNNPNAIGSGNSQGMPSPNPSTRGAITPFQRLALDNPLASSADKIFGASQVRSQRIASLAEFSKALPSLVRGLDKQSAQRIASALFGQDVDMSRIDSMIQQEAIQQQFDTKIKEIQSNIAVEYGEKGAANAIALQEQSFNKISAEIGLMHSTSKVNDAKIHALAAEYCEKIAHAYNLRKQGDVYSVQAYILDNIKEYNIELQKLNMFRAQRQDSTERALFESLRDVRSYQMNDPEAKDVQLENYKTNNDTFWNEVKVIMSSWQVHTNVGFSGSFGSKDVYGHGFGY